MAEKPHPQEWRYQGNLTVDKFNRQTGNGIYILDLDHAGANLETPFPLSLEYHVEFSFFLPGSTAEVKVSGRVMRKQQLTVPGRYHLRVQFYAPRWDLDTLLRNTSLLS
jgi:PilZ domain